MSKPTLYELRRDYEDRDTLDFAITYTAKQEPIYPREVTAFRNCFGRKPLSQDWNSTPVIIKRGKQRTDIFDIELCFAVNEKAKEAISKLVGPFVEFLPVKLLGERAIKDDRNVHRPTPKSPKLFLINPLVEVDLGKGSISHKMAYRHITRYVFHPDDVKDLPIFRAKEDQCILVGDSFRQVVESKRLSGLQFEEEFEWFASTKRASTKPAVTKKIQKIVEPPPFIPDKELRGAKRMQPTHWENIQQHWKWICDAAKARKGSVDKKPKISRPISKQELAALRKKIGMQLPSEFEDVLVCFARKVSFAWDLMESPLEDELPKELRSCGGGCGEDLWDVDTLPELAEDAEKHRRCGMAYFEKAFDRRLPFIAVGTGDYIAFDMQRGTENCPIVYLSHENADSHNCVLGRNFVEFMLRWSSIGCVGPDFPYMAAFWDVQKKQIDCHGGNAKRWRSWMASGE